MTISLGRGDVQRVTTGKVILIAPSIAEPFARIEQQGKRQVAL